MNAATYDVQTHHDKLTVVVAKFPNGFTITKSSGCVDPRNYDAEYGKELCMKKIEDELWYLEGYALSERLYQEGVL
jgi:hypothetical protein